MLFKRQTKKRTSSRFVQTSFQSRVKRASGYRRSSQGLFRDVQVLRALAGRVRLWPFVGASVLVAALALLMYYPPLLHVRRIAVAGLPPAWAHEVQQQAERYISSRRLWVFPGRNVAIADTHGLGEYLTAVNPHVERVAAVVQHWPHVLEVQAVPRIPAYDWSATLGSPPILISNDGKVLPETERSIAVPLRLYGSALATTNVGGQALSGDLLQTLEMVRTQFMDRTGLRRLSAVRLVPIVAARNTPSEASALPTVTVPLVVPTITHEVWLEVAADESFRTSDFTVQLDLGTPIPEALDRLKVLLRKQPAERLAELVYIDMRFSSRAYVCVRSAPCAATGLQAVFPTASAQSDM